MTLSLSGTIAGNTILPAEKWNVNDIIENLNRDPASLIFVVNNPSRYSDIACIAAKAKGAIMIREEAIYDAALKQAASEVLRATEEQMRAFLFPIWRDAAHEILLLRQICACQKGGVEDCFLKISSNEQRQRFDGDRFNFYSFLFLVRRGRQLFFDSQ